MIATLRRHAERSSYAYAPLAVAVALFVANAIAQPEFVHQDNWASTMAVAAPYVLTAMAQALPLISGGGGLDLSVGPFAGFVGVIIVAKLEPHGLGSPWILIPIVLLLGLGCGAVNGILVALCRLPPIIATLGTYLFYTGASAAILATPGGAVPHWIVSVNGEWGPIPGIWFVYVLIALAWIGLSCTAYVRNLLVVGGDMRTAYTAGINVAAIKVLAYAIGGMLGAIAGLLLTGLLQSGDATAGPPFTVASLSAVALGGIALAGGRGGLLGAALGGVVLFLIQNLLTAAKVSVFQLDIANGLILIGALALNGAIDAARKRRIQRLELAGFADRSADLQPKLQQVS